MPESPETPPKSRLPVLRYALWGMVALVAALLVFIYTIGGERTAELGDATNEPYGTPFSLVDQTGAAFTQDDLRGAPTAIFFGFTHCPDICPTTLYELAGHRKAIEAEGEELKIVFVTVDPERDTPEILGQYVGSLGTEVTALTGEPAAVAEMLDGWGIEHRKVGEGDNYSMDHTASVILLGAAGQFVGTIAYGENPDTAREKLQRLATL